MDLDRFLDKILENVMSKKGIEKVKQYIREDVRLNGFDYNTTQVAFQVFDKENNYEPRVEITSEGYDDGEIIFIDYHLD